MAGHERGVFNGIKNEKFVVERNLKFNCERPNQPDVIEEDTDDKILGDRPTGRQAGNPASFPQMLQGMRKRGIAMDDVEDFLEKRGLTRDDFIDIVEDTDKLIEFLWADGGETNVLLTALWIVRNKHDFFYDPFPSTGQFTFEAILFTLAHAIKIGELKATVGYLPERVCFLPDYRPDWNSTYIKRKDLMEWIDLRKNKALKALTESAPIETPSTGSPSSYLDTNNPNYSPKMAANESFQILHDDLQAERAQHEKTKEQLQNMVDKLSIVGQERDTFKSAIKDKFDVPVDERSAKSYLHIIGAMLEIIMEKKLFKSETALRDYIHEKYTGFDGCASRTTAGKFSEAKKLLSQ